MECSVCKKELNEEDRSLTSAYDYQFVCKEHRKYANYVQSEVLQKEIGLISEYSDKFKKCEICNVDLNENEVNSITKNTGTRTCEKHKLVRGWTQLDLAKYWFEFVEFKQKEIEYNEDNYREFKEWLKIKLNK